jgi:iron(III) transport system permease protein
MISCIALERPGTWRAVGIAMVFSFALVPAAPLLWHGVVWTDPLVASVSGTFGKALQNSAMVALAVAAVSSAVGSLAGISVALYEFPGRRGLCALAVLPLLVPTFLWAIGWSSLTAHLGPAATQVMSGLTGSVLVFCAGAIPFVLLASYAAAQSLSGAQVEAARLAGGERTVLVHASRHVSVPALLAASLGGVLTLSDPGPGQILGLRTASSEILTSFSALYDFALAGRQCMALTATVLVLALPLAWFAGPRLASQVLVRQSGALRRVRGGWPGGVAMAVLGTLVLVGTILPTVGLILPLVGRGGAWGEVAGAAARTWANTLIYATGAGATAAILGLLVALLAGRSARLRSVCLGAGLALFCLPPAFSALGLVRIAAAAPAWADPILRSRVTVCVALGLRMLPVAVLLGLRAWGSTSPSWAQAGGLHGVPLGRYLRRVAKPALLPAVAVAGLLVALLGTADIGTVLLLHPPGEPSFPLAVFTVMANAPESLVASLCLAYLATAAGFLMAAWGVAGRRAT